MSFRLLVLLCVAAVMVAATGCASYYPVQTTAEDIAGNIEPGDTVRVFTREHGELKLLVTALNDYEMRGRVEGSPEDVRWLRFDQIQVLEIQRLNMRRALLSVVLPVVVGAIVACNNDDCSTRSVVDARF